MQPAQKKVLIASTIDDDLANIAATEQHPLPASPAPPALDVQPASRLSPLLDRYPFLVDTLKQLNPAFSRLENPILRATMLKIATISTASTMSGVPVDQILRTIRDSIAQHAHMQLVDRKAVLREILVGLHTGRMSKEQAKRVFADKIGAVSHAEIASIEESLVQEGAVTTEQIAALCNIHAEVMANAGLSLTYTQDVPASASASASSPTSRRLGPIHGVSDLEQDESLSALPEPHPLSVLMRENRAIQSLLAEIQKATAANQQAADSHSLLVKLRGVIETHYSFKENQLFPMLEKYAINVPPKVMWSVHDKIRALCSRAVSLSVQPLTVGPSGDTERQAEAQTEGKTQAQTQEAKLYEATDSGRSTTTPDEAVLATCLSEVQGMVDKEERILFPMLLNILQDGDWLVVAKGGVDFSYHMAFTPAAPPASSSSSSSSHPPSSPYSPAPASLSAVATPTATVKLNEGSLSLQVLDKILCLLPVDITFVDAHDKVAYYSAGHRVFPRTPAVIGRDVRNCHPPASVHRVLAIIDSFRDGSKSEAEFWIQLGEPKRFLHIQYFAVRSSAGEYLGVLEVTQDATHVRSLDGQRRLLDWENYK